MNTNDTVDEHGQGQGWLDAATRALQRLLSADRFKGDVNIVLNAIDPASAPGLVRAALWTDPSVTLSALAALPRLANAGLRGLGELLEQMHRFPPALLTEAVGNSLAALEVERAGRATGRLVALVKTLLERDGPGESLAKRFAAGLADGMAADDLGRVLDKAATGLDGLIAEQPAWAEALVEDVARAVRDNPHLREKLVAPLISSLLDATGQEVRRG